MTRSWRERRKTRRYEKAGTVALGQARLVQAPMSLRTSRWLRRGVRFLLAFSILVGVGALWLTFDKRFYIYRADVVGAHYVAPDEIFQASGLMGLHILWACPDEAETRILNALPSLENTEVGCRLPGRCAISVVERQPWFAWDEGEKLWWIDAEGVIFPAAETVSDSFARDDAVEGRLVRGALPRGEDGRLDRRVQVALSELWASEANIPKKMGYVPGRGLVFADDRGWRVVVGEGSGMDERLRVLESVTAYLESRGVTPRFVDVRFPETPYYSVANAW